MSHEDRVLQARREHWRARAEAIMGDVRLDENDTAESLAELLVEEIENEIQGPPWPEPTLHERRVLARDVLHTLSRDELASVAADYLTRKELFDALKTAVLTIKREAADYIIGSAQLSTREARRFWYRDPETAAEHLDDLNLEMAAFARSWWKQNRERTPGKKRG